MRAAVAATELADAVAHDEPTDHRVLRVIQPVHGVDQVLRLLRPHQVDLAGCVAEAARAVAENDVTVRRQLAGDAARVVPAAQEAVVDDHTGAGAISGGNVEPPSSQSEARHAWRTPGCAVD